MYDRVGSTMIAKANEVDFIEFLEATIPEQIKREGDGYARFIPDGRLVFSRKLFYINGDGKKTQDLIQFLRIFADMSFQDAVRTLCDFDDGKEILVDFDIDLDALPALSDGAKVKSESSLCPIKTGRYEEKETLFSAPLRSRKKADIDLIKEYLLFERCLMVEDEVRDGIIYPENRKGHVNIVFQSRECEYAEIRASFDPQLPLKPFKGKAKGSARNGYWIVGSNNPDVIYITEAAIDALSLMRLRLFEYKSAFVSVGGASCTAPIGLLKKRYPGAEIVIAFDNDEAGNDAAKMLKQYRRIVPEHKDWNEDLVAKCIEKKIPVL